MCEERLFGVSFFSAQSMTYANRMVAFLFVTDSCFEEMCQLPDLPLRMVPGWRQGCVVGLSTGDALGLQGVGCDCVCSFSRVHLNVESRSVAISYVCAWTT